MKRPPTPHPTLLAHTPKQHGTQLRPRLTRSHQTNQVLHPPLQNQLKTEAPPTPSKKIGQNTKASLHHPTSHGSRRGLRASCPTQILVFPHQAMSFPVYHKLSQNNRPSPTQTHQHPPPKNQPTTPLSISYFGRHHQTKTRPWSLSLSAGMLYYRQTHFGF